MTNILVKSVVGPDSYCVNLLDDILCHGPDSLSVVVGGQHISFNTAILCSLSPLLSTMVKQSMEDNCCFVHDEIFVFLPQLRNWKTVKQLKTFLSSGMVDNISRVETDDLQNLLHMLGFSMSSSAQPAPLVQDEAQGQEEQFFVEIKCEVEDDSELLGKQDVFTSIQLERNDYEEIKNLITNGSGAFIDRDFTDVGSNDQEIMQDEDSEINYKQMELHQQIDCDGNYNTEVDCIEEATEKSENKLSKGSERLTDKKIDAMEVVESVLFTSAQEFECEQRSNSYTPCRNKTLPVRLKRKLPNRKAKHSVFENIENECPRGKNEKKISKISQKYPCDKCDYKATYPCHLKLHIMSAHEGVRFRCSQCDFKSIYKRCVKEHSKAVHEGVRFPCNECDYKGTRLKYLKHHIKAIHEKIQYSCSQCDFKSTYKSNLVTHNKVAHE